MDGDVRLGQHGHPGDPALRRRRMQVDVEQRRSSRPGTALERRLDVGQVVQALAAKHVDDEVQTRTSRRLAR